MNCTKEEFTADYIKAVSDGMTPEEFEKDIEGTYSIKFAEEMEKKEQENILNTHIKSLWENLKDRLTCDESKFTEEYKSQFDKQGDSFNEDNFSKYILDKYGKQEEKKPSNNNNNSNNGGGNSSNNSSSNGNGGSSSNNNYTPPANPNSSDNGGSGSGSGGSSNGGGSTGGNDQPSYTPPADNGGSGGSSNGGSGSGGNIDDIDLPIGGDDLDDIHLGGTD